MLVTVRLRDWTPVPHDLVQVDQAEKLLVAQCTGHRPCVQYVVSAVCGQALPPNLGATWTRVRDLKPSPQDLVQVDHESNEPATQLTGHAAELHDRASNLCGQALPPKLGSTMSRLRFWLPVPHDWVQVDQVDQAGTTQSTAHGAALQLRVSVECGQATPPNLGSAVARAFFCEPVPHDLVQVVHADQAGTAQLTAQAGVLQARVSV